MTGLTTLGTTHTIISLVAVASGFYALARYKLISTQSGAGRWYIGLTTVTCLTGFGIFQHGGFGKPHILGIITLVTLGFAYLVGRFRLFGRSGPYVEAVAYSLTLFFHAVPAITETLTRLPAGSPIASNSDAPIIQQLIAACFLAFIVGSILQVFALRRVGLHNEGSLLTPTSKSPRK